MFDKRAQALAALRAAELQTGVTPIVELQRANRGPTPVVDEESLLDTPLGQALPVRAELADLVPGRQITPGAVLAVTGSRMLIYQLLSAASQAGNWVAIVGEPNLGVVALVESGLVLERVAVVPDPGINAANVCAALLDAMSVVIGDIGLTDAERRRLAARARERGTVIVSDAPWAGANLAYRVVSRSWVGANQGEGWLQHCRLAVERTGRAAAAKPKRFEIELSPAELMSAEQLTNLGWGGSHGPS